MGAKQEIKEKQRRRKQRAELKKQINELKTQIKNCEAEIKRLKNEYHDLSSCGERVGIGLKGEIPFSIISRKLADTLKYHGIRTWKQLRMISTIDLLAMYGFGKKCLIELQALAEGRFREPDPRRIKSINERTQNIFNLYAAGVSESDIALVMGLKIERVRYLINKAKWVTERNKAVMDEYKTWVANNF